MRKCTNCSKEYDEDVNFCPCCGKELSSEGETAFSKEPESGREDADATSASDDVGKLRYCDSVVEGDSNAEDGSRVERHPVVSSYPGRPGLLVKYYGLFLCFSVCLIAICALFFMLEFDYFSNIRPSPFSSDAEIIRLHDNDPNPEQYVHQHQSKLFGVVACFGGTMAILIASILVLGLAVYKRSKYVKAVKQFMSDNPGTNVLIPSSGDWFFLLASILIFLSGLIIATSVVFRVVIAANEGTIFESGLSVVDASSYDLNRLITQNYTYEIGLGGMFLGALLGLVQVFISRSKDAYKKISLIAFIIELVASLFMWVSLPGLINIVYSGDAGLFLGVLIALIVLIVMSSSGGAGVVYSVVSNGRETGEIKTSDPDLIKMLDKIQGSALTLNGRDAQIKRKQR